MINEDLEDFEMLIREYVLWDDDKLSIDARELKYGLRKAMLDGLNKIIGSSFENYEDLKDTLTCGCGLCLVHNNMRCPKLSREQNENIDEAKTTTNNDDNSYTVITINKS